MSAERSTAHETVQSLATFVLKATGENAEFAVKRMGGFHLGLTLAMRHPEYAAVLYRCIVVDTAIVKGPHVQAAMNSLADRLVASVPLAAEEDAAAATSGGESA